MRSRASLFGTGGQGQGACNARLNDHIWANAGCVVPSVVHQSPTSSHGKYTVAQFAPFLTHDSVPPPFPDTTPERFLSSPLSTEQMSYRNDNDAGYDRTLLSSVPDPTRAEKQVRAPLSSILPIPVSRISKLTESCHDLPFFSLSFPLFPLTHIPPSRPVSPPAYLQLRSRDSFFFFFFLLLFHRKGTTSTC